VARKAKTSQPSRIPSEAEIIEFLNRSKGSVGKREIARAFNVRGGDKQELKKLLRTMADEGKVSRRGRLTRKNALPDVSVVEIADIDRDGELIGTPVDWDDLASEQRPLILIRPGRGGPQVGRGDRVLAAVKPTSDRAYPYEARIVRKLLGEETRVLGVFRLVKGHGGRIVPVDKKARHEFIVEQGDENGALPGELVEIDTVKTRAHSLPKARVRRRLGDLKDQRNISLIAVHEHGIPTRFPEKALHEAQSLKHFSPAGRVDLRDVPLITIDPPDARDHDDAVHAEPDGDAQNAGGFKVIVAIADVAHYVRSGAALDREARMRGNSVYFPDRVVPMLPEKISNDLCSLRENEDRACLACLMTFDRRGTKVSHRFARAVMRSHAKLSYEEAQAAIDGSPNQKTQALLGPILKPLWQAFRTVNAARARRGPLELDLPERKIVLDAHGLIERVFVPERLDAHKLIEEFMIQANVAAAETLEERKVPLIYRVHEPPSREKLVALSEFLRTLGLPLPLGQVLKPKLFNAVLDQVKGKDFETLVNQVVLRSQAQAVYLAENRGHFGLNLRRYAHFTSPIRRYADLVVHRALITAHGFGEDGLSHEDKVSISETAELISATERRAMAAERATIDRLVAAHLSDQIGARFDARINGLVGAGLFVTLSETGADGFVPAATLGADRFLYNEKTHALVGARTGETYRLGDKVEVVLKEVAPVSGGLRFEMVTPGRQGEPAGPRGLQPRRQDRRSAGKKARRARR
jgi:ribonuclease R